MRFVRGISSVGVLSVSPLVSSASATPLIVAQIPAGLKTSFQAALGLMFMIGFIWGVINIWSGANKMKHDPAEGKASIASGIMIAGAGAIMGAFFYFFGMSDGALTPQF